jgi:hypothetical protein
MSSFRRAPNRTTLIAGIAVATALVGCSSPSQDPGPAGAAESDAAPASPRAPAEVMVVYQPAQICRSPAPCRKGDEVVWVPSGTRLQVRTLEVQELPHSQVHWFGVEYEGRTGWISEFSTNHAPRVVGGRIERD